MDAIFTPILVYLSAKVVWEGTRQRFGSLDELRTLLAVVIALLLSAVMGYVGILG